MISSYKPMMRLLSTTQTGGRRGGGYYANPVMVIFKNLKAIDWLVSVA